MACQATRALGTVLVQQIFSGASLMLQPKGGAAALLSPPLVPWYLAALAPVPALVPFASLAVGGGPLRRLV